MLQKMIRKRGWFGFLLVLYALFSFAYANPLNSTLNVISSGRYDTTGGKQVSLAVEGGNVTQVFLNGTSSTTRWTGFFGNATLELLLGDSSSLYYIFSNSVPIAVYASQGGDIDFSSLNMLNTTAKKNTYDGIFGFSTGDIDSITSTFSSTSNCVAGTFLNLTYSVTPLNSSVEPGAWDVCAAEDGGGLITDIVFGTNIIAVGDETFNGGLAQFQLMVPVTGSGDEYYFYLEI